MRVARGAIPADADPDRSGAAALSLSLPDRVQNTFANAIQRPVGATEVWQFAGHGVLNVFVLAASAFEQQLDFNLLVVLPLVKMQYGRSGAEIVAAVLPGQGIHGVGPQLAKPCGFRDGCTNHLLHLELIGAHRSLDFERRHARILANRTLVIAGHVDIGGDDRQGLRRLCARLFAGNGCSHRLSHIGRQIGGSLRDQFLHTLLKKLHKLSLNPALGAS